MNLMHKRLFFGVATSMALMILGIIASTSGNNSFGVVDVESVFKNQKSLDPNEAVYNSNVSKSLGSENISLTPHRMTEEHYIEQGILKGIGNLSNNQTFFNTYLSDNLIVGRGNGTMKTFDGQKITWISSDLGKLRGGQWVYYGVMLFNNTNSKSFTLLNNSIALSKSSYPLMEPEYIWLLEK
jgi:hypothetical protein